MSEPKVLAKVGEAVITDTDVDAFIAKLPEQQQMYASHPQFRQQVVQQLISMNLFAMSAKEQKLDETEEFKVALADITRDLLAQSAIDKLIGGITVSDEEAKEFYEANASRFTQEEAVGAKHILVDSEEKCNEVLAEINAGKAFEDAAKEYSSCPSKAQGGDLGMFGHGQMVAEFDQAAFEAEVGSIVGPVKTQFGYHLIQVYKKSPAITKEFDEIKEDVKSTLLNQKQHEAYDAAVAELYQKYM